MRDMRWTGSLAHDPLYMVAADWRFAARMILEDDGCCSLVSGRVDADGDVPSEEIEHVIAWVRAWVRLARPSGRDTSVDVVYEHGPTVAIASPSGSHGYLYLLVIHRTGNGPFGVFSPRVASYQNVFSGGARHRVVTTRLVDGGLVTYCGRAAGGMSVAGDGPECKACARRLALVEAVVTP